MEDHYTLAQELRRKRDAEVMAGESLYDEGTSLLGLVDRILPGAARAMYKYSNPLTEFLLGSGQEPSTEESAMNFGPGAMAARITPMQLRGGILAKESGPARLAQGRRFMDVIKQNIPKETWADPELMASRPSQEFLKEDYDNYLRKIGELLPGEHSEGNLGGLFTTRRAKDAPMGTISRGKGDPATLRRRSNVGIASDITQTTKLDPDVTTLHETLHAFADKALRHDPKLKYLYEKDMESIIESKTAQALGKTRYGKPITAIEQKRLDQAIPSFQDPVESRLDFEMGAQSQRDARKADLTKEKFAIREANRLTKLRSDIESETAKMNAYLETGQPVIIRKGTPDLELHFNGIQKIPNHPDQFVYTDKQTGSTFYSYTNEPKELLRHRDEMREKFNDAKLAPMEEELPEVPSRKSLRFLQDRRMNNRMETLNLDKENALLREPGLAALQKQRVSNQRELLDMKKIITQKQSKTLRDLKSHQVAKDLELKELAKENELLRKRKER